MDLQFSGGGCVSASRAPVTVTVSQQPTTANAGTDQTICMGNGAGLSGNAPSVGTGAWSIVSGPDNSLLQFNNVSVRNTAFTPTTAGTYVLQWTISNSPCTPSSDDVTITVKPKPQGSLTANGPFCGSGTGQLTWTATAGTGPYTITYHDASTSYTVGPINSGVAFNATSNSISNSQTYTLDIVTDATCSRDADFTGDAATVTIHPTPATPANPTSNSPQCASNGVTITAAGSAPSGETWYWQTAPGGTSIANDASSPYLANASGTYYVRARNNTTLCWSPTSGSLAVTINTAPTFTSCPTDITTAQFTSGCTSQLTYSATASGSPLPTYTYTRSGATNSASQAGTGSNTNFNIGGTAVAINADNVCGTAVCNFNVTVQNAELVLTYQANGNPIADGFNPVSTSNGTDFGSTPVGTPVTRTLVITNSGNTTLTLVPNAIGAGPGFSVSQASSSSIAPNATATFTMTFNAASTGTTTSTISIASTDCNSANFAFNVAGTATCATPLAQTVTGSGAYCPNSSSGRSVGLSASETGVSYQLYDGASLASGSAVTGTGGAISFGGRTAGTYTVTATRTAGGCTNAMSNSVVITQNAAPSFTQTPGNQVANASSSSCDATVTYVTAASGTPAPSYTYSFSGATSGNGSGTGSGLMFNKGVTNVTILASNGCGANASTSFTVDVSDVTAPSISCAAPVTINMTQGQCTGITTLTPPTVSDNCAPGNALDFDGSNDYLSFSQNLSTVTDFTYEAWVRVRANQSWARILDFGNSAGFNTFLTTSQSGTGQPRFVINNGTGERQLTGPNALPLNSWTHIAVTLSAGTNTATMYINGAQIAQNTNFNLNPSSLGITTNNWIGRSQYNDPYFNGALDEVRMWSVARSQAQIQSSMHSELNAQAGLIAVYHFNQGVAGGNNSSPAVNTAADASGSSRTGMLNNFTLTGATSNWIAGTGPSLSNNAPATYPKGNTTVTWTATDASNNVNTCTQVVTVLDNQAPKLTCPTAGLTLNVAPNTCAASYTILDPITDNCSGATWGASFAGSVQSNPPPSNISGIADGTNSTALSFNRGSTSVVLTGTDGSNTALTCSFTVTVIDNQAPTIAAPANITNAVADAGKCYATITNIGSPVIVENCTLYCYQQCSCQQ